MGVYKEGFGYWGISKIKLKQLKLKRSGHLLPFNSFSIRHLFLFT